MPKLMIRGSFPMLPFAEIDAQGAVDRLVGAQGMIIDLHLPGPHAELFAESPKVLEIILAQTLRIDEHAPSGRFQAAKLRPFTEGKLDLLGREDVKEQHFVALMPEMSQGAQQRRG